VLKRRERCSRNENENAARPKLERSMKRTIDKSCMNETLFPAFSLSEHIGSISIRPESSSRAAITASMDTIGVLSYSSRRYLSLSPALKGTGRDVGQR